MFRHSSPHPALRATLSRSRAVQIKNGQSAETPDQRGLHSSHPLRGAVLETIASPGLARFARSALAIILAALRAANGARRRRAGKLARGGAQRHPWLTVRMQIAPRRGARRLDICSSGKRLKRVPLPPGPPGEGAAKRRVRAGMRNVFYQPAPTPPPRAPPSPGGREFPPPTVPQEKAPPASTFPASPRAGRTHANHTSRSYTL